MAGDKIDLYVGLIEPDIAGGPRNWRFTMGSPSPNHRLAVADGSGAANALAITCHPDPLRKAGSA